MTQGFIVAATVGVTAAILGVPLISCLIITTLAAIATELAS